MKSSLLNAKGLKAIYSFKRFQGCYTYVTISALYSVFLSAKYGFLNFSPLPPINASQIITFLLFLSLKGEFPLSLYTLRYF